MAIQPLKPAGCQVKSCCKPRERGTSAALWQLWIPIMLTHRSTSQNVGRSADRSSGLAETSLAFLSYCKCNSGHGSTPSLALCQRSLSPSLSFSTHRGKLCAHSKVPSCAWGSSGRPWVMIKDARVFLPESLLGSFCATWEPVWEPNHLGEDLACMWETLGLILRTVWLRCAVHMYNPSIQAVEAAASEA